MCVVRALELGPHVGGMGFVSKRLVALDELSKAVGRVPVLLVHRKVAVDLQAQDYQCSQRSNSGFQTLGARKL
eukprot:scaffold537455_cov45-Prasinocladus_malaysianus.AAC.1